MGLDISLEKIKIREEKEKNIIKKSLNCDIENLIAIFLMKQEILSPNWRVVSVYFL